MPDSKTITYIPKQFESIFPICYFYENKKYDSYVYKHHFPFHILKHKYYIILTEDII